MLICSDKSFYVGNTWDLAQRLEQQAAGAVPGYTSKRLPVELIWSEYFESVAEAYGAEKKLHGWGRAKRLALAQGDWDEIKRLARSRPNRDAGPS